MTGRNEVTDDWSLWGALGDVGNGSDAAIHQTGHSVLWCGDTQRWFGNDGAVVAYLMEGGSLTNVQQIKMGGVYAHFRQTGGNFVMGHNSKYGFYREAGWESNDALPADFVFGGDAQASNRWQYVYGDYHLAVMDDAVVDINFNGVATMGALPYKRTFCMNGGELYGCIFVNTCTNNIYSFNGGARRTASHQGSYGGFSVFGNTAGTAKDVYVRVYEKGGAISHGVAGTSSGQYGYLPHLLEPVGNVVWTVELTDAVKAMEFDVPPAVVITDLTGSGSNAVAVVDYDYASKSVTNITVLCRGEAYSGDDGAVTAELRLKATGEPLATLVCTVGPCQGGDFTFGGKYSFTMYSRNVTNDYHGATIVDMDPDGYRENEDLTDPDIQKDNKYRGGTLWPDGATCFKNTERIVMKSGILYMSSTLNVGGTFPALKELELYGGHLAKYYARSGTFAVTNLVVGGKAFLGDRLGESLSLVSVSDTIYVDAACIENGVTPAVTNGTLTVTGATVAIKDWSALPRGRRQVVLDLSGVATLNGEPEPVASDEGVLQWVQDEKKLYARRHSDGMFLIFK